MLSSNISWPFYAQLGIPLRHSFLSRVRLTIQSKHLLLLRGQRNTGTFPPFWCISRSNDNISALVRLFLSSWKMSWNTKATEFILLKIFRYCKMLKLCVGSTHFVPHGDFRVKKTVHDADTVLYLDLCTISLFRSVLSLRLTARCCRDNATQNTTTICYVLLLQFWGLI